LCLVISTVLSELKDFLRSQPLTYAVKLSSGNISETVQDGPCYYRQCTNRKSYMAYQIAAIPMTLSDLQGHSPVANFSNGFL